MADRESSEYSTDGHPDDDDIVESCAAAFELVQNDTRFAVIRELAAAQAAAPHSSALRFSTLRNRLGNPDSGTFNYHLTRLQGRFIAKTEEGYKLTPAGHRLAAAVAAGVYGSGNTLEGERLDEACPVCDADLSVSYGEGALSVRCPNGHGLLNLFPGGALPGRTVSAVRSLFDRVTRQQVDLAVEGDCPLCYGQMERSLVDREEGSELRGETVLVGTWGIEAICRRCGAIVSVPVEIALGGHPVVEALLSANGHDPRERHIWGKEPDVKWKHTHSTSQSALLDVTFSVDDDDAGFQIEEGWRVSVTNTPEWLDWSS